MGIEEEIAKLEKERKKLNKEKEEFEGARKSMAQQWKEITEEQQKLAAQQERVSQTRQDIDRPAQGQSRSIITNRIGDIKEFNMTEDWNLWIERLDQFFIANDICEEKKASLFLTLLGSEGYALLRNLCTPALPASKSFPELLALMKDHLQPKPSVITERYKFKECRQNEGEGIKEYLTNLKKLSTYCEFGVNLNCHIRDQLVWGLRNEAIKKRILSEKNLTYVQAVELAQAMEAATKDAAEMGLTSRKSAETVNFLHSKGSQSSKRRPKKEDFACYRCGRNNHQPSNCRYRQFKCNNCNRIGHLSKVCKTKENSTKNNSNQTKKNQGQNIRQNFLASENYNQVAFDDLFHLGEDGEEKNKIIDEHASVKPFLIDVLIHGNKIEFLVDTGSDVAAVSEQFVKGQKIFQELTWNKTHREFRSHPGQIIKPIGVAEIEIGYKNVHKKLQLFLLPGDGPPILGRAWIRALPIAIEEIIEKQKDQAVFWVGKSQSDIDSIFKEFDAVFSTKLGLYNKKKVQLHLKEGVSPVFCKPRPLAYAMREKVENELERLGNEGIIEPVESCDWATPVVPVLKSNGKIRLCGDYKITINPHIKIDRYPIPRVQDLLAKLNGGILFTKIDLSQAYQQLELDKDSRNLVTISTHKGLFRYKRLCFGVASAPGLFQREMDKILSGIDGVVCFFDDILISGRTSNEHNERLSAVLRRLEDCGLTLRKDKCELGKKSVKFLGYVLDGNGTHVSKEKIEALLDAPIPKNLTQLRAFLGMVNYYSKFIKNYSRVVAPLYEVLQKCVEWRWNDSCNKAFQSVKQRLAESEVLVHYNPQLPIKISCDASPFGLGAVLSHVFADGSERPIAFASRTLNNAEKNYSQLDKEALGLILSVKKFHQFIFGRRFTLETDHKPLVYIFGSKKGLPQMAANRVQRWAVLLSAYDFEIKYIKGSDNVRADALSRVPLENSATLEEDKEYTYLNFVAEEVSSINVETVYRETSKDPILSQVHEYVLKGWPEGVNDELKRYKVRERELTVEQGCVLWGYRIVIPQSLQQELLNELHSVHDGIVRMKSVARAYIWWPNLDKDIESIGKRCELCLKSSENPPRANLHSWKWPSGPNHRLHLDFLGPIEGKMYIVIIDAFSKWLDVKELKDITSETTIKILKEYFCTWGIPLKIVTDNGPSFCSKEFSSFLESYGVAHTRTAPYHPASNGAAENAVRTFKNKFKLLTKAGNSRHEALCKFLFYYRATPHCTTDCSPAELQMGRKFRTKLDLLRPTMRDTITRKQTSQQKHFNGNRQIDFKEQEAVMVKDYSTNPNSWRKSLIREQITPVTYNVTTDDNRVWKRHTDKIKKCDVRMDECMMNVAPESEIVIAKSNGEEKAISSPVSDFKLHEMTPSKSNKKPEQKLSAVKTNSIQELRRSTRVPKPRKILDL